MNRSLLAALVLTCACDPRAFDDLADQTWVDVSGKPEALDSDNYGVALGFGGSGPDGVRVVVASRTPAGVARLVYDASGSLEAQAELVQPTLQVDELAERPAMAGDPSSFGMATGTVALGATTGGSAHAILIDVEASNLSMSALNLGIAGVPAGLAFGLAEASGAGTGPDLVAVAGNALAIKPAYQTNSTVSTCTLPGAATAVHLADLGGDDIAEVVVGFADGTLEAYSGAALIAASGIECGAGTAFDFALDSTGAIGAIASGDFDGNGEVDLAVGLGGEQRVALLMNAQSSGAETSIDAPSGASGFGPIVAVGDFDGDGDSDLAVGDPAASAEGTAGAGSVFLYKSGAASASPLTLHDASPDKDQAFGQSIAAARFGASRDLLVVGTDGEIFTYFRNPVGGDDVRN